MTETKGRAVVLLSGGLDSYTTAAIARDEGYAVHALTVRYGQTHFQEVLAAKAVAASLGVARHAELEIDLRPIAISALTGADDIPKDRPIDVTDIPATYVPARNTVFLALALAWAESIQAHDIFIGVNAIDYSGYPDCRPEFIAAFERLAKLGTKAGIGGTAFRIHAPLANLTKAEIIKQGLKRGLDYGLTLSCYDPGPDGRPCLRCDSCWFRAKGFAEVGVVDPLLGAKSR
jgi:7-cyano-7-deazaguanine synthase